VSENAAKPGLKPIYLICGTDRPKVRRAVARLRKRVFDETASDINVFTFDARATRAEAVLGEAQTPTFALGTRLLLVAGADKWPAGDRDRVVEYLKDPAPATCLALSGESFKKTERLTKMAEKLGQVLRYDLPKRYELPVWVRELARSKRLHIGAREASHLVERVGTDPEIIERELEKLAAFANGQPITEAEIDTVCAPALEATVFQLMDAVGQRDVRKAFRCLEILYANGEDHFGVFYTLLRHVRLLRTLNELSPDTPPGEVARVLGVAPFRAKKLVEQRRSFDRRELDRALVALADAEADMKGRAGYEPKLALEMALARLIG
jgi:DNA polymerase-3 subunit delta